MTTQDTNYPENHNRAGGVLAGVRLGEQLNTDEERRTAALHVASNSTDATDCRNLLEALGLIDPGFEWVSVGRARRRKVEQP